MGILKRRNEARRNASFHADHEQARHGAYGMRVLLLRDHAKGYAWPWLLDENWDFRNFFQWLSKEMREEREVHSSLRAHYDRLAEVAIDVLVRRVREDFVMSDEQLVTEVKAVKEAYERLLVLDAEAWESDARVTDASDSISLLLQDAEATVARNRELA